MNFSRTLLYILALVAVLLAVKFLFLTPDKPVPVGSPGKGMKIPVTVMVVNGRDLENKINGTGTLISNEEVIIIPEITGRVEKIFFREGSLVKKGDLLIKINDDELAAQLKKLKIQRDLAHEQETRQKKLLEINGISRDDYEIALNRYQSLEADLELTEAMLSKTSIRAPFKGRIGLKTISEGSIIHTDTRIAILQQTDPIKIDFSIPEKYASHIREKDIVNFTVQGSEQIFKGSIYAIEPRIDPVTRTLSIRAKCSNEHGQLLPGSFARIELVMESLKNIILIPTHALIPELKGQKVFLCRNGKAEPVKVKTGIRTDTEIQITEGLQEGDSLVVTGFMQLKPGSDLRILGNKSE